MFIFNRHSVNSYSKVAFEISFYVFICCCYVDVVFCHFCVLHFFLYLMSTLYTITLHLSIVFCKKNTQILGYLLCNLHNNLHNQKLANRIGHANKAGRQSDAPARQPSNFSNLLLFFSLTLYVFIMLLLYLLSCC